MGKKGTTPLLIELEDGLHTALKHLATNEKTSMADIVRACVKTRIADSHKKIVY